MRFKNPFSRPPKQKAIEENTHLPELLSEVDAMQYAHFFRKVLSDTPHYTQEEKHESIDMRTPEAVQQKITDPNWLLIAIKNNEKEIIGSIEIQLLTNPTTGGRVGNIKWILTDPHMRGKGIASKLNSYATHILTSLYTCEELIAGIKDTNIASIKMHEKNGFRKSNMRAPEGVHWYVKALTPNT